MENRRSTDPMLADIKASLEKLSIPVYETRDLALRHDTLLDEIKGRGCTVAAETAGEMIKVCAILDGLKQQVETAQADVKRLRLISRIAAAVAATIATWLATVKGLK